jgi:hypothetical protein
MMRRFSGALLAALLAMPVLANTLFAKPPDLPQDSKIVVAPQVPCEQEAPPQESAIPESGLWRPFREGSPLSTEEPDQMTIALREFLSSSLFIQAHPFLAFWGETCGQPSPPAPMIAEKMSPCPYLIEQNQSKPIHVVNPYAARSVMDNLRALEQAAEQMQLARQFAGAGRFLEALECLEKVRALCPGSSYDRPIEEAYGEFIAAADAQMEKKTEASEEEPQECGCCWCGWLNQFGMCWMDSLRSYFMAMHMSREVYDPDPDKRVRELLENSEDLRLIEKEWERIVSSDRSAPTPSPHVQPGSEPDAHEEVSCPRMCGSACPKCEAMHAKYLKEAGIKEQVNGLMKACYLAISVGHIEKAADLARQAHALDPARVEGDPLIYKMHLLAEQSIQTAPKKGACPKSQCPKCCPTEHPGCDEPGPSVRPNLPRVSDDVPVALDEVLTGKDVLSKPKSKKGCFTLGVDLECCGVSVEQTALMLQGWFLPPPLTEHSMQLSLGISGIAMQGAVPYNGVDYMLYFRDGLFFVWMTPEKAKQP